ncbi:hypothetical protein BC628DRAFT_502109 [Trametes gibbosa]|nr:hypothetical protein BC628DRAFT_502109 [Trametes gibbosa]
MRDCQPNAAIEGESGGEHASTTHGRAPSNEQGSSLLHAGDYSRNSPGIEPDSDAVEDEFRGSDVTAPRRRIGPSNYNDTCTAAAGSTVSGTGGYGHQHYHQPLAIGAGACAMIYGSWSQHERRSDSEVPSEGCRTQASRLVPGRVRGLTSRSCGQPASECPPRETWRAHPRATPTS